MVQKAVFLVPVPALFCAANLDGLGLVLGMILFF
jgi:hypothetical protein